MSQRRRSRSSSGVTLSATRDRSKASAQAPSSSSGRRGRAETEESVGGSCVRGPQQLGTHLVCDVLAAISRQSGPPVRELAYACYPYCCAV